MKFIILLSILALNVSLTLTNSLSANAQKRPATLPVESQWNLSFNAAQGLWFQVPVSVGVKSDGRVIIAFWNSKWIKFTKGEINGDNISLEGTSHLGDVKINAKIINKEIAGQWKIGLQTGDLKGTKINSGNEPAISPIKIFDFVSVTLDKQFYDPQFNGADWRSIKARYRREAASARSEAESVTLIRDMLKEIGASHLEFYRDPPAPAIPADERQPVGNETPTPSPAPSSPVVGKKLSAQIGYIQIKRFEEGKEAVEAVDRAFTDVGNINSLIIDLRDNGGGTLSIGMRLCDYLFSEMRSVGYLFTRKGVDRLKIKSLSEIRPSSLPIYDGYNVQGFLEELRRSGTVMLKTGGRASKTYRGRLILLINERSASASEAFAASIKESTSAILIGQRTAGAMLSSAEVQAPGGWTLRFPEADFVTANGSRVEGRGVEPHIYVIEQKQEDTALKRALEIIKDTNK